MRAYFSESIFMANRAGSIFQPVNIGKFQPRPAFAAPELTFVNQLIMIKNSNFNFIIQNFAFRAFINLKTRFHKQFIILF
jgi:hypothetical protein